MVVSSKRFSERFIERGISGKPVTGGVAGDTLPVRNPPSALAGPSTGQVIL